MVPTKQEGTVPTLRRLSLPGKFQLFLLARIVLKAISTYNGLFLAGYIATLNKEEGIEESVLDWQLSPHIHKVSTSKTQALSRQGWHGPLRSSYKISF